MMKLEAAERNGIVEVSNTEDFNLDNIFDCGQCFRWEREADGSYVGAAFGRCVRFEHDAEKGVLRIHNSSMEDFDGIWRSYLDLDREYGEIKHYLAERDTVIRKAIEYGPGIRILNQEKWETLISFIISQNNNIPRIRKCVNSLAETLGERIGEYHEKVYYSLPSPEVLAGASLDDLAPCRLGYRAGYLIDTARMVCEEGLESLELLGGSDVSAEQAQEALRRYAGVGPKVANCISLFSMNKIDSFPIDVWVRKVMHTLYGIDEGDVRGMADFASEVFGKYGGIAQQYLFYYITHNKDDLQENS